MDIPAKKILRLLQPDQPLELRVAAARVLGEVGPRDAEIGRALVENLADPEPTLRLTVIEAVSKLRVEPALPQLLERVQEGGPESVAAAQAAARLGPRGVRALQEQMGHVAPGLRRTIASALAAAAPTSADWAGFEVLRNSDPGVVEAAARSFIGQVPTLSPAQRHTWTEQLVQLVGHRKEPLAPAAEVAAIRLLGALDDAQAEAALWDRSGPGAPPSVRAAALQALGKWVTSPSKEQRRRLLEAAAERDFQVVAPALVILQRLPVGDRAWQEWLPLFDAPDPAARRMALDKVGDRDQPAVAEGLLRQLSHPDAGLRDAAVACLSRLKHGRLALTRALTEAATADQAWGLAKAQAPFVQDYPPEARKEIAARTWVYLEAGDPRAEPLLFLLRQADAVILHADLEQRAEALRKKKAYEKALHYLRHLARDPACALPTRLELAACSLKVSGHALAPEAWENDPSLQQFASLSLHHGPELFEQVQKLKWLAPEDLFYLGFHLAGRNGPPRKFAGDLLKLVLQRSPRSKLAQSARSKLRSEGLE